ncbi:IS3 family transposase [Fictibacillus sp. WQ 8-8]
MFSLIHEVFKTSREEVQDTIADYMHYYNEIRIQNKYGMSPLEYRTHAA